MRRVSSAPAAAGIEAIVVSHRGWSSRDDYDARWSRAAARDVGLVCLAGFMRIVGGPLIDAFPNAILNIHPSLLPSFPGVDAQRQALEHGVKVSGVTVHLVTRELDAGPIVLQRAVPVLDDDDTADDAVGAHTRRGAPRLSRGRAHRARWRLDDRGGASLTRRLFGIRRPGLAARQRRPPAGS